MKRLSLGRAEYICGALTAFGVLFRLLLIVLHWPVTNGDEGIIDLMAQHIVDKGERPIFFYGQDYMGSLEAYIGAVLFSLFGPSLSLMRVGLLPLFALFLLCLYVLTSRLYTKGFALLMVAMLALGSSNIIFLQLVAAGGYPEILFLGTFIFLLTTWLILRPRSESRVDRKRLLLYGGWGFVVGFSLWTDQILLPCILSSSLLLWLFCRHELRFRPLLVLLAGFVLGIFPLLLHDLTSPFSHNSLVVLVGLQQGPRDYVNQPSITFLQRLIGTFLVSLPSSTGVTPSCYVKEPLPALQGLNQLFDNASPLQCALLQGSWSVLLMSLWGIAVYMALRPLQSLWRQLPVRSWATTQGQEREELALHAMHLALSGSAALSLLLFAISPIASLYPRSSGRYLFCLLMSFPALLWPLWKSARRWRQPLTKLRQAPRSSQFSLLISTTALLFLASSFVAGSATIFQELPDTQAFFQHQDQLTHVLLQIKATRIYTDYGTCNRLIFHSHEQIICSTLSDQLKPAGSRYPLYQSLVQAEPHPAYVFPLGSKQATSLGAFVEQSGVPYERIERAGYVIYYHRDGTDQTSVYSIQNAPKSA